MQLKYIILVFVLSFVYTNVNANKEPLGLNDVSLLLPLPHNLQEIHIRPTTQGALGELVPRRFFDEIPNMTLHLSSNQTYKNLRAVGIRLDPCFPEKETQNCLPQIRIVWQPLDWSPSKQVIAIDAALHTFYSLSQNEFHLLIQDIVHLKKVMAISTSNKPLNVHPILQKEDGIDGPFGQRLMQIILRRIGEKNLIRLTFMQLAGAGNVWNFGGYDIVDGKAQLMKIPRISKPFQSFVNNSNPPASFTHGMFPEPEGEDNLSLLVRDSNETKTESESAIVEGALSSERIENPLMHNPNTVDCVSCHVAQSARMWAVQNYSELNLIEKGRTYRYTSLYELTNTSPNPGNTKLLRSFGYDVTQPAINQRVINETAAVLEYLNKN